MSKFIIVTTTIDKSDLAEKLAIKIIENKLGACVQIFPIKSFYNWQGKLEKSDEFLLFIKTKKELFKNLQEFIRANHSYELPEIISFNIKKGLKEYKMWMLENLISQ